MTDFPFEYRDRSYPNGSLEVDLRGDFVMVEYSPNGYDVDSIYVPAEPLYFALRKAFWAED